MIILLSRIADDTTYKIIEWLDCMNKPYIRVNNISELLTGFSYDLISGEFSFCHKGVMISAADIQSFYFLGGGISTKILPLRTENDPGLGIEIGKFLTGEVHASFQQIFDGLITENKIRHFGLSPFSPVRINKLSTLQEARKAGLAVPDTALVTTKRDLLAYQQKWGRVINKSIDDGISIQTQSVSISGQQTIEVDKEIICAMDTDFFPSLIQRLIEKQYEIRVFYFEKQFRSIAIFSQSNDDSQIDGRQINAKHLIRHVPFLLPSALQEKICVLMDSLFLNYGSIDLIKGQDGIYYFLEVNPYGQFGFLSSFANYHLEQKIASYL